MYGAGYKLEKLYIKLSKFANDYNQKLKKLPINVTLDDEFSGKDFVSQ